MKIDKLIHIVLIVLLTVFGGLYLWSNHTKRNEQNRVSQLIKERHALQIQILQIDSLLYENRLKIDSVLLAEPLTIDSAFNALQRRYAQPGRD